jgi:hypothetical protein
MRPTHALLLIVIGIAALAAEPGPQLKFTDFKREGDSATVRLTDDNAVITIESPFGIGGVTATAMAGPWPREVTLRLRLKSLEGFTIVTDRLRASGSQGTSGKFEFSLRGAKGEFEKVSGGGDYVVAGTLDIRVEKRKDEIVVTLPANLLADTKSVRIEWIDAYRG